MKNQYVGDIGDFSKLGMLRAINKTFSLGINWYLTQNDKKPDGKFLAKNFVKEPFKNLDEVLFKVLEKIDENNRDIKYLESNKLWKNTEFFSKTLNPKEREDWHKNAIKKLSGKDIIFCDPDNGLEIKTTKPKSKNGNKYTTYKEIIDYYKNGASIIVYNHRDRKPQEEYLKRFLKFKDFTETKNAKMFYLRASRFSVRDYLFIIQDKHFFEINKIIEDFLKTKWKYYLTKHSL